MMFMIKVRIELEQVLLASVIALLIQGEVDLKGQKPLNLLIVTVVAVVPMMIMVPAAVNKLIFVG